MSPEDFEVLKIIGQVASSPVYKVMHKRSGKMYAWKTVNCHKLTETSINQLEDKIKIRKYSKHPHLVRFYDIIKESPKKYYIVTEFCVNGSLKDVIANTFKNNAYFTEELLCRIFYQIAFTLKTIDQFSGKLSPKEIFFDDKFNVKLYNFDLDNGEIKELKMYNLGHTILQACTRKLTDENKFDNELIDIKKIYSSSLVKTIMHISTDNGDLKSNVNSVLCHPTILLKSTEWCKDRCFLKFCSILQDSDKKDDGKYESVFIKKMEKLRSKEIALQGRERTLNEREHKLLNRERTISVQERIVKEKMHRAELYLQRCQDSKSCLTGITDSSKSDKDKNISENLDSTYVSCGDSVIVPTGRKLNVNEISKPFSFTRTLSERKTRFKGHSPLKDIDFNKKKITKPSKIHKENVVGSSEWLTCSDDYDKRSNSADTCSQNKKAKNLLLSSKQNNLNSKSIIDVTCKPIVWTEENKRHAFDLLRLMNEKENKNEDIKHTYL